MLIKSIGEELELYQSYNEQTLFVLELQLKIITFIDLFADCSNQEYLYSETTQSPSAVTN